MGKTFDKLLPEHEAFISRQPIFFVATAPLAAQGHVNLSPKGYDVFRIFSPTQVGYLDLTGSGNETAAHILENGRITFMFMAIDGPPQILRLYGTGYSVHPSDAQWPELSPSFPTHYPGIRQIIMATIHQVSTSCGYGVPYLSYQGDRDTLSRWAEAKGRDGIIHYQQTKNRHSLDGLPTNICPE
ncbi:Pyridoxamine 5'-phosphate oxidase [Sulfobacillus thermosulfidooxidans DSM 9293]|uniref:Pyridoxamine 5'-phosphate oxidase n=1 Tax=Sulfobacillus thermosulfidooxidans (strain DSM 9293 / VKM B-1269 / AT-1) TaxID=929705 RepID=A0A1W1W8Z2_SULTA|nr:pyridoxamine 5'-phosphate oxidase family protein [Sulfobacillus thermosulfidooxidans]SMC02213.1 Pyridoxamine 5'-phosphate oxidase [Sulfobacillus thermosulfidooxidans DSM 9293]